MSPGFGKGWKGIYVNMHVREYFFVLRVYASLQCIQPFSQTVLMTIGEVCILMSTPLLMIGGCEYKYSSSPNVIRKVCEKGCTALSPVQVDASRGRVPE